ncbi:MAG: hypothetical protein P4L56_30870 [Candidatus Sulfopaludibacter sp.]|nr:hypothetical protein [Candidatus Sulfopaludibacter sp.]
MERYRRLRALTSELNHRMIKTIPRQAYDEVGDAIGILHDGVLVLDSEDMSGVLMDCCIYDWFQGGRNLVQQYAAAHPAKPGTEEDYILSALVQAKYRVLVSQSAVPDAGIHCRDALSGEGLFLMDVAFSHSLGDKSAVLATRTIPLGEYWMSGGAALPVHTPSIIKHALRRPDNEGYESIETPGVPLLIVRACLAAGAADYIRYEGTAGKLTKARREPRWPGSKRRRHLPQ